MRGWLMILLTLCGASGCLESRALQSGKYLCVTKTDCGYGWDCVYGLDPEGRGLCVAPEHLSDAGPGDAFQIDAGPSDAFQIDAGPWLASGVRWTNVKMGQPFAIATIANLQLPPMYADGTYVTILRAAPHEPGVSVYLQVGTGVKTSDNPVSYTFESTSVPPEVSATLGTVFIGSDGRRYTPFATDGTFETTFQFVGNATDPQPPLYLYKASLTGNLDPDLMPTSQNPPLSGTLRGCFTAQTLEPGKYGAGDVYITLLSQTVLELITSSGGVVDADCTGSGANNGYRFELQWDATERVDLPLD